MEMSEVLLSYLREVVKEHCPTKVQEEAEQWFYVLDKEAKRLDDYYKLARMTQSKYYTIKKPIFEDPTNEKVICAWEIVGYSFQKDMSYRYGKEPWENEQRIMTPEEFDLFERLMIKGESHETN